MFSAKNTTRYGIAVRLLTSGWVISFFAAIRRRIGGNLKASRTNCDEFEAIWRHRIQFESICDEFGPICDDLEANWGRTGQLAAIWVDWRQKFRNSESLQLNLRWLESIRMRRWWIWGAVKKIRSTMGSHFSQNRKFWGPIVIESDWKKVWRRIRTTWWHWWRDLRRLLEFHHNHIRPL